MEYLWGVAKCLVAYLAVSPIASPIQSVKAHGYLATPAARNVLRNSDYCPQCLNAGGPSVVYAHGQPGKWGACGDPWNGPRPHEKGPYKITGAYKSGGTVDARVVLTANHLGRWSLRLCTNPGDTSQRCFDKNLLRRADGKGPFVQVPGEAYDFKTKFVLPKVRCSRCVLQWTYETGNSCNPPGTQKPTAGLPSCDKSTRGERFWNCADISIS